jgi:hypothetical protein
MFIINNHISKCNPPKDAYLLLNGGFIKCAGRDGLKAYKFAWEETMSATEEIVHVEGEVDERAKGWYGV